MLHIENSRSLGLIQSTIITFFAAFLPQMSVEVGLPETQASADAYDIKVSINFERGMTFNSSIEVDAALSTFTSSGVKFLGRLSAVLDDFLLARAECLRLAAIADAEKTKK